MLLRFTEHSTARSCFVEVDEIVLITPLPANADYSLVERSRIDMRGDRCVVVLEDPEDIYAKIRDHADPEIIEWVAGRQPT